MKRFSKVQRFVLAFIVIVIVGAVGRMAYMRFDLINFVFTVNAYDCSYEKHDDRIDTLTFSISDGSEYVTKTMPVPDDLQQEASRNDADSIIGVTVIYRIPRYELTKNHVTITGDAPYIFSLDGLDRYATLTSIDFTD
ncbi:hypothetical protein JS533_012380 [Bifidobacterium amazonense]|uniref:Uncharacterized protein n=1 Tax=Bifidobacterium amazonense TaxID=2809027 RepID=A0ABS9VY65_9BIFI|nr:hypothetical protein [Bifidobacterium amazonense]MCH9277051.1 hypothetical protein [Bifidobacterium amazonense]